MTMKVPAHLLLSNIKGTSHSAQATSEVFGDLETVLVVAMILYPASPSVRRAAAGTFLPTSDVSNGQTVPFTPFMIGSIMCNGPVSSQESFHKVDVADKTRRHGDDEYVEHLIDVRRACERAGVRCDDQQLTDMLRSVCEGTESGAKWRNVHDDVLHSIETYGTITLHDIQEELRSLQQKHIPSRAVFRAERRRGCRARNNRPVSGPLLHADARAHQREAHSRVRVGGLAARDRVALGALAGNAGQYCLSHHGAVGNRSCQLGLDESPCMERSLPGRESEMFWSEFNRLGQIRSLGPRGSKRRHIPSWEEESFNPKRVHADADDDNDEHDGYHKPSTRRLLRRWSWRSAMMIPT